MPKSDQDKPKILSKNLFPVVGIGASAGGLDAFRKLIQAIPENSGMAYILVQHLHPEHESALPEILQRETKIQVVEISDNVQVKPNHIYVIPSNKILVATDGILQLSPRSTKEKVNLPIDIFFSSLAEVHQSHAIGVILSGTGSDGCNGLKSIREHDGLTFAQEPGSAAYDGMPQRAIDAEVIDFVLPPESIPQKLIELQQSFNLSSEDKNTPDDEATEDAFIQILALIKARAGVDFSFYKQSTIRRRIIRRMVILKLETVSDYLGYLKKNKPEPDILYQDLLIHVTSFFRDSLIFDTLCETVFPEIVKNKPPKQPLRIWIAGCSTGQEAYSMAMCLHEYLNESNNHCKVQVFATDISEKAINKARSGIYSKKETEGILEERLTQFFDKKDGHYHVKKAIRDLCIFAVHNFLKDPSFAKMDLISCRNVLIYFEPFLQKKALDTFHYALNDKGILWLGKSETAGNDSELFIPFGKKDKFYTRKPVVGRFRKVATELSEALITDKNYFLRSKEDKTDGYQKNADQILLAKHTPPGVIVNEQFDIVQFRGLTGDYLELSPGKASLNVLKMAREGLAFELRNALHKAKTSGEAFVQKGIAINGGLKLVTIEVIPLLDTTDLHFLILFRDEEPAISNQQQASSKKKNNAAQNVFDEKDFRIQQLEKELLRTREDMRSVTNEQEVTNEELQSFNEELLSGSEELQSLNEELETSKEELQSTNEELTTVNQELDERNEELTTSRRFAEATISVLHEPLLVLDRNYRIKTANNSFLKAFKLTENETLGKIIFELQDYGWDIPGLRKELANIQKEKEKIIEVEITFTFPVIGERVICFNIQPITRESGEQLILMAFNDLTSSRNVEKLLKEKADGILKERQRLYNFLVEAPALCAILKAPEYVFEFANNTYLKFTGQTDLTGKTLKETLPELEAKGFYKLLDDVYKTGKPFIGKETPILINTANPKTRNSFFDFSYQVFNNLEGEAEGIFIFAYDVTEQVLARKKIEDSQKELTELANAMPQLVWIGETSGEISYFNNRIAEFKGAIKSPDGNWIWAGLVHADDIASTESTWQTACEIGTIYQTEHRLQMADGTYRWYLSRGIPHKNEAGHIINWFGTTTDIQKQKVFAEELEKQIDERMKLEIQKNNFISMASHELKTPVTSIKGYTQLLYQKFKKEGNTQAEAFLLKMDKQINKLNLLISDLLDATKVTEGKLKFNEEIFDFNELVLDIADEMQQTTETHKININVNNKVKIFADRNRIGQVITNLISNSIKYSPTADNIKVTSSHENDNIKFSVQDFGIGIAMINQPHVFDQFYRVSGLVQETFAGLGLGLFISSEIIKKSNGAMYVESEMGKGSTFSFTIPVANNGVSISAGAKPIVSKSEVEG